MRALTRFEKSGWLACLLLFLATQASVASAADISAAAWLTLAYIGPGAGLGLIGSLLALLIAVVLGLVGLVIYPIKLIKRLRRGSTEANAAAPAAAEAPQPEVRS